MCKESRMLLKSFKKIKSKSKNGINERKIRKLINNYGFFRRKLFFQNDHNNEFKHTQNQNK